MRECAITPYVGDLPYIFVSYAHKDSQQVYPILEDLNRLGYRVWYDDGVAPGSEWPEEVAQHLNDAYLVISMLSPEYVVSENCLRELQFSLLKGKCFLGVFLEETPLTLGLEMQLSAKRCILKYNYPSQGAFVKKLCTSPDIAVCRDDVETETAVFAEHEQTAVQQKQSGGMKQLVFGNPKLISTVIVILGLLVVICFGTTIPITTAFDTLRYVPPTPDPSQVTVRDVPYLLGDESNLVYYEGMDSDFNVILYITELIGTSTMSVEEAYGESKLHLEIPETLNGLTVRGIDGGAFDNCLYLKRITLPSTVQDLTMNAFTGCTGLEEVEVLGETGEPLEIQAPVFAGCTSLKTVILPGRVTFISSNAFNGCSGLKELVLPETLTSIGIAAFKQTGLEELCLPDSVETIEESAFESCSMLRTVVLPKSLKTISYRTFYDCTTLESVWIPASVTTIEEDAFFNCSSLQNVYFEGTEQQWKKLMSKIDFDQPEGSILRNNMALQKAEVHFNS